MQAARVSSAIALMALSTAACAQIYLWKDPEQGNTRVSTLPPAWYSPNARAAGPDVIVTRGQAVIDDTSLSPGQRSRLTSRFAGLQPVATAPSAPQAPPHAGRAPESGTTPPGAGETARLVHEAYEAEAVHRRAAERLAAARRRTATASASAAALAEAEAAAAAEQQARAQADQARRLAEAAMQRDAARERDETRAPARSR